MVLSMTGYGRAGALLHGRDIKVELRSVNARFFEYSSRLPRSCAFLEDKLKKLVASKVSRGKVELSLSIQTVTAADTVVTVNWQLAEGYRAALNAMAERMDLKNDVSVGMLSRFPDVLTQTAAPTNEDELWEDVRTVAEQAVDAFVAMRAVEGEKMKADVAGRLTTIETLVAKIEENSAGRVQAYSDKLYARLQELLGDLMDQAVNPSLAPYAKTGEVMLRLTAKGDSPAACEERMAPLLEQLRGRLGAYLYGIDVSGLEETVLHLLHRYGKTFSAAESCTGGLIAKRITDLPGASCVFRGGVVSYTNEVKTSVLGVPQETLDRYGAVSEPVARAMAEGVRRITGSDLSVATTGLAGPDGDDRGNPVGTVFVALSTPERTVVRHMNCGSGRDRVRMLASHCAFDLLRRELEHLPIEGE